MYFLQTFPVESHISPVAERVLKVTSITMPVLETQIGRLYDLLILQ